jgi:hypothetical protein
VLWNPLFRNFHRPWELNLGGRSGQSKLQKTKSSITNMNKKELKSIKYLRPNKDITILLADEGDWTVVLDESKYKDKLQHFARVWGLWTLAQRSYSSVERKVEKLLSKHKTAFPPELKYKYHICMVFPRFRNQTFLWELQWVSLVPLAMPWQVFSIRYWVLLLKNWNPW